MTRLNLQRVVDQAIETSGAADPHVIARNALMRIKPEQREEALLVALAVFTEVRIYDRQEPGGNLVSTIATIDDVRTPK